MTTATTILIAEDQGMLLGALSALLDLEPDMQVVGKVSNGKEALAMAETLTPDIVITDIEMPEMTGLELAQCIQQRQLTSKVIILTTFARSGYLRRAMDYGVKGYLLKDAPSDDLANAIRRVMQGRKIIAPELIVDAWEEADPLSDKERKALKLAADGKQTEQIASEMHLSPGTVRNYLSSASSKLNASNRIEAARIARQKGWL
ncbi:MULTISPECIES: response regulator transcription factor [Marisediminitalea]|jgi:two-component system response regulator DesR|uniref:response regulator transcription factor n=1 Tax=Marisediminitalea TaxID=2662254 RepID=UPI0020CE3FBF|nr:response regulator transcription factor [Marisediminitalea aggregata]MCP3862043.1 response regulator transcription factor [Aestuariibacter sp.]MCP4234898.1 response regulator transcription factor [Aestuariibacter sp.]MCP4527984.1 response regulator transcription factor [Aestuariibacter sp.]MCP4948434.1 response regulator transcription factor [Aestuariibacter sp.]MCP5009726.1 response regulator transcription factor [Aestuariibacter sp.]|tara:strand:+ start:1099 stop:1710 length:612 start_codon:yes stop_codon:yes gene_type:complete